MNRRKERFTVTAIASIRSNKAEERGRKRAMINWTLKGDRRAGRLESMDLSSGMAGAVAADYRMREKLS